MLWVDLSAKILCQKGVAEYTLSDERKTLTAKITLSNKDIIQNWEEIKSLQRS